MVTTAETAPTRQPFFETCSEPSPGGSTESLPPLQKIWEKVLARGIAPRWAGPLAADPEGRREFLVGASMMGYELVDLDDPAQLAELAAMDPPRLPLQPQQLLISDAIDAGIKRNAIEVPRRASKSTTIFCKLLGRCACRPGYRVVFSAQTGTAGTEMFEEWVKDGLDYVQPPEDADLPPWQRGTRARHTKTERRQIALFGDVLGPEPETPRSLNSSGRTFATRVGNSRPGIRFDNHSTFRVLKPEASAYRGKAADVSWLDEAQELDPAAGSAIIAGVLPLMDTRPGTPQIIVSGTAGEAKTGPFWSYLSQLRKGDPSIGGLDYAADPHTDWADIENEETAMQLVQHTHPGVDTLTTMDRMRDNYRDPEMGKPQWAREYLSIWPDVGADVTIDPAQWDQTALEKWPDRPARIAFGMDIKPGGSIAAIAAAWRDRDGRAYIELVDHQIGTAWLPKRLQYLTRQGYRGSSCAFDKISEGEATYLATRYIHPRPKLQIQTWAETAAGCVTIMRELESGTLRHHAAQSGLNAAVTVAKKREVKGNDRGVWIFTADPGHDVTPLLAATRALRNWDQHYERGHDAEQMGVISA